MPYVSHMMHMHGVVVCRHELVSYGVTVEWGPPELGPPPGPQLTGKMGTPPGPILPVVFRFHGFVIIVSEELRWLAFG